MAQTNEADVIVDTIEKEIIGEAHADLYGIDDYQVEQQNAYQQEHFTKNIYKPVLLNDLIVEDLDIQWIWQGFLAKGYLTLFSALWKVGKTTLILHLLRALQNSLQLAGQFTTPAKVLIVSEESEGLWARRRDENDVTLPCWVLCRPIRQRLNYKEWIDLLEQMARFCKENDINVFILDTVTSFWNVDNENDAARVQAALLPLNHLLDNNIAVLLIHHFRKSGGDEAVASRGSGALASYADIIIEFTRLATELEGNKRVLKAYSRFEETPQEIVIELTDGEYQLLGSRTDANKMVKINRIVEAVAKFPEGVTASELYENWDDDERPSLPTIRRHLKEGLKAGSLSVIGKKTVGKTESNIFTVTNNDGHPYKGNDHLIDDIEAKANNDDQTHLIHDTNFEANNDDQTVPSLIGMNHDTNGRAQDPFEPLDLDAEVVS